MQYEEMNRLIFTVILLVWVSGCSESTQPKTQEMEIEARNTVLDYLAKNDLPNENLASFKSAVKPSPDFSYLYTGGGRCIEFIVLCHEQSCKELRNYPYDEHGEQCP
jgi:hypothetical protein